MPTLETTITITCVYSEIQLNHFTVGKKKMAFDVLHATHVHAKQVARRYYTAFTLEHS